MRFLSFNEFLLSDSFRFSESVRFDASNQYINSLVENNSFGIDILPLRIDNIHIIWNHRDNHDIYDKLKSRSNIRLPSELDLVLSEIIVKVFDADIPYNIKINIHVTEYNTYFVCKKLNSERLKIITIMPRMPSNSTNEIYLTI